MERGFGGFLLEGCGDISLFCRVPVVHSLDGYGLGMRKIVDGCGGFVLATALLRMRNQSGATRALYLSELPGGYAPYS